MRAQPETGHLLLPSALAPAAEEETEAQTSGGALLPKDKGSLSWNQHPLGSRRLPGAPSHNPGWRSCWAGLGGWEPPAEPTPWTRCP